MQVMRRILVVHPGETVGDLARRTMQRMSVDIDIAPTAEEASFLLRQGTYSVVVVDFATTGSVLHDPALRKDPKPVVILHAPPDFDSSRLDPELVTLVVSAGDAATIIGVVLSCVVDPPADAIPGEFLSSQPSRLPQR